LEIISNTFCNFAKLFKINLMIKISDSARDRLLQIMKNEEGEKKYVRVGVESGGCSGLSYKLDFDLQKLDDDELINDNKIQLLVNKKSFLYLVGTTLEFSDGLNGKGFVFNNPNASRTCGCGESFSL
jgi:iron-sulfur cluster assembly protein